METVVPVRTDHGEPVARVLLHIHIGRMYSITSTDFHNLKGLSHELDWAFDDING